MNLDEMDERKGHWLRVALPSGLEAIIHIDSQGLDIQAKFDEQFMYVDLMYATALAFTYSCMIGRNIIPSREHLINVSMTMVEAIRKGKVAHFKRPGEFDEDEWKKFIYEAEDLDYETD